ncbi:MAG: hypothetical protein AAGA92_11085 [Planctomycetota bacterium]
MWRVDPVGGGWALLLLAALVVTVLAVRPRGTRLNDRRRRFLVVMRLLSAGLLLLLLLRPSVETVTTETLPGTLLMLIDDSRSMQVEDSLANQSRWVAVRSVLEEAADKLDTLGETWDIKPYLFADQVRPVPAYEGTFELPAEPLGSQTALGFAIDETLRRESQQRIIATLLLSDGAQRAFAPRDTPPQTAVRRLTTDGIPLYTFTFGKPASGLRTDLRVSDLLVPPSAFSETPLSVSATVSVEGYSNESFTVRLLWENAYGEMETVDTRKISVDAKPKSSVVNFAHTPTAPGEYKIAVEVESPEGELIASNNSQSTFVNIVKGGVNVLYLAGSNRIGGGPGIESRFVRQALAAHADINVDFRFFNYRQPRADLRKLLKEEKRDAYLLGNVDASALDTPSWRVIADAVESGAGLAMLGGFHSFGPGGFRGTPIEPTLPMTIGPAERQNFGEPPRRDMHLEPPILVVPRPLGGLVHPIMRLEETVDSMRGWQELPPLDGANRFEPRTLKPNAQVIAVAEGGRKPPLIVTGAWGRGRTIAAAFDSTWRWQLGGHPELLSRFWRQMVLWLAQKDESADQRVWVKLDQRRYERGSRVEFSLGATGEDAEPVENAVFEVVVERPDGGAVEVRPTERAGGVAGVFQQTGQPGDYRVVVRASADGKELGGTTARFTVPDLDTELDQPAAEPTLMASLAGLTADAGGEGLAPEQFGDLLDELAERTQEFEEETIERITLWDTWPAMIAFVAAVGAEWWLRKRWGLV